MPLFADLHIHSPYSRAVSKNMTLEVLAQKGREKGLGIIGTGDFSHPLWFKELKAKLAGSGDGMYDYNGMNFVLSNEISLIYTQDGKGRRIHHMLLAPDLDTVAQINELLASKGRLDYDGRPIFGFSSIELVESLMPISKDIEIIPAHCWTPWFGVFGSMSGFDSLKACFQDKAKYIHAIETGLSSDPLMNWRCPFLDNVTLLSNSDSHSPQPYRLGREANAMELKKTDYKHLLNAIRTREGLSYTIEVAPDYGKYHLDGHRDCDISMEPKETAKHKGMCPKCGKPLTIGVLNRVEQLASPDRPPGFVPRGAPGFKTLLPLTEVVGLSVGQAPLSKKVQTLYELLISKFGNEMNILLNAPKEELQKAANERLANMILKNREGGIKVIPGYDGVYGKPVIEEEKNNGLKRYL
ncbi:MAG: DNA helicase UvrD [Candidatus Aenigmarchaeota archaeon]|nr:DNA helicase UvrD [Candidatus Aenigmarchaeota archaeon]